MKKLLITAFIFLVAILGMTILKNNISNPSIKNVIDQNENAFLSLNNELSIILPSEFQVSTSLGVKDKYNPKHILVATSSEDLLTIKMLESEKPADQKEVVDLTYEEIKDKNIDQIGSEKIVWNKPNRANFGQNYFVYHDGIRYRTIENQPMQENIRQYVTYYGNKGYIIDFVNFLPNPNKSTYWDQIVSSISFN